MYLFCKSVTLQNEQNTSAFPYCSNHQR